MPNNKIKCPVCGSEEIGAYFNLRRFYTADHLTVNERGEVEHEGWGEQVDDMLSYLACNGCDAEFDEDALREKRQQEEQTCKSST